MCTPATAAIAPLERIWTNNIRFQTNSLVYFPPTLWAWFLDTPCRNRIKQFKRSTTNLRGNPSVSHTGSTNSMTMYRARSKDLWAVLNRFSPLLSVGRGHGMATLYGIITTAKASCKCMHPATEGGHKLWQKRKSCSNCIKEWTDMTLPEHIRATDSIS